MIVQDVFHIRARGTVITGQLQGNGQLNLGETVSCDGLSWQVTGIEQFRASLTSALPGASIGVMLAGGPPGDVLRGRTVHFGPEVPGDTFIAGPVFGPGVPAPPKKRRFRR